jgi:methionine aminotransferase
MSLVHTKLPNTETSIFSVMSKMANEYNALNLSQGFPNFESDPELIALVERAMINGHNQYAPMPGDIFLRERIIEKTNTLHNSNYTSEENITVTAGATQAIFTAIAATIHRNDEVIIFTPAYDCYAPSVELFGGVVKAIQLKAPHFTPDWNIVKDAITDKTKMVIINTPHNPTGTIWSEEDMLTLQSLLKNTNILLLSDEVYEHLIYDNATHYSAAKFEDLRQRSFITASFGKTFHNTGWKMGYCIAPKELTKEFQKVHQYNVFSVNAPIQKALATYLNDASHYLKLSDFYQQKRDFFLKQIQSSRFKFTPAKGTYFQSLDFSEITTESDVVFAERLTKDYGLATIPTSVFNKNKEDFKLLRVCFAKTDSTLEKAASILNSI